MASGKTTVGKELAAQINYTFYDLDQLLEEATGKTIGALFDMPEGKEFRILEREMLLQTFLFSNAVIACGGGTPCFYDNMEQMSKHGLAVWVRPDPELIIDRLRKVKHSRPLLAEIPDEELPKTVLNHYSSREPFYTMAPVHFNPEEETIDGLVNLIKLHK